MASVLFTISGAVLNALAFSGTNFFFNNLTDHGEKAQTKMIWHLKSFRGPEKNGIRKE